MSKFKGRFRRWRKKFKKFEWKAHKKDALARGMVEVGENTLVPKGCADKYPPFIPTHLGGKAEKKSGYFRYAPSNYPRRSVVNQLKKFAAKEGISIRQWLNGDGT